MVNPGYYGKRRFERLDYSEAIAQGEIATTAVGTSQLKDSAVTPTKLSSTANEDHILVQLGAGNSSFMVPKPPVDITLTEIRLMGSIAAATTGTTGYFSVDLVEASSGFGTTTTLCGTVQISGTTANILVEATSSLSAQIGSTQALIVVAGATTLVDNNAAVVISYTKD